MAADKIRASRLASEFVRLLADELNQSEWRAMARQNKLYAAARTLDARLSVCASHDYCDANMAMLEAFELTYKRLPHGLVEGFDGSPEGEADCQLWNEAWGQAHEHALVALPRS